MVGEDVVVVLGIANFLSASYTAFCIDAASKHYHWFHEAIHWSDLWWYATWYSCQTIAFLVSASNSIAICVLTVRVLQWLLQGLVNENPSTSSQADSWAGDRVNEKERENEMSWSKHHNYHNRSKLHLLPMYNDCPFTPASAKRFLSPRLRQISAWGREITAPKVVSLLASVAVVVAALAAIWNVAFVPFLITNVGIHKEDKLVMIPWNDTK